MEAFLGCFRQQQLFVTLELHIVVLASAFAVHPYRAAHTLVVLAFALVNLALAEHTLANLQFAGNLAFTLVNLAFTRVNLAFADHIKVSLALAVPPFPFIVTAYEYFYI